MTDSNCSTTDWWQVFEESIEPLSTKQQYQRLHDLHRRAAYLQIRVANEVSAVVRGALHNQIAATFAEMRDYPQWLRVRVIDERNAELGETLTNSIGTPQMHSANYRRDERGKIKTFGFTELPYAGNEVVWPDEIKAVRS